MEKYKNKSRYLTFLLRHKPEDCHLEMDKKGYVSVQQLIENINKYSNYSLTFDELKEIVRTDNKQRFKIVGNNIEGFKVKCNQGHSIPWVIPEINYNVKIPDVLYHGTTEDAWHDIQKTGYISKMSRHAVHMQQDIDKAWSSATRRKNKIPIVLVIDSRKMNEEGLKIGVTENDVWCVEKVPVKYIKEVKKS